MFSTDITAMGREYTATENGYVNVTLVNTSQYLAIYAVSLNPYHYHDKTCKSSFKTCTSLADLVSITMSVHNIIQGVATCSQSQRNVQSMVSAAC